MTKTELFLELAKPNDNGVSRWVLVSEFVGKYKELQLGNGGSWCRASSSLAKNLSNTHHAVLLYSNGIRRRK